MALTRKQNMANALCRRLSLDPRNFSNEVEKCEVKDLCTKILKSSQNGASLLGNEEVMKWISFAENLLIDSEACIDVLCGLNEELAHKSVLLGNGLKLSEADIVLFAILHPLVITFSRSQIDIMPHVLRWMVYVQCKENVGDLFVRIPIEKAEFEPRVPKIVAKIEINPNVKDPVDGAKSNPNLKDIATDAKNVDGPLVEKSSKKDHDVSIQKKIKGDKDNVQDKKKPEKETAVKVDEVPANVLNIQVGLIRKAWKHPSADSLLVEEIDVGEAKARQVVSGLAKYCSTDELLNQLVILITNVKPGKLRDVVSEGLVLCASNEDHSVVEPLLPPEGARLGERVQINGYEGKPEDVLNPKKKQLEKITPHLFTDDDGIATYKGIPFMTSAGPCISKLKNASIK